MPSRPQLWNVNSELPSRQFSVASAPAAASGGSHIGGTSGGMQGRIVRLRTKIRAVTRLASGGSAFRGSLQVKSLREMSRREANALLKTNPRSLVEEVMRLQAEDHIDTLDGLFMALERETDGGRLSFFPHYRGCFRLLDAKALWAVMFVASLALNVYTVTSMLMRFEARESNLSCLSSSLNDTLSFEHCLEASKNHTCRFGCRASRRSLVSACRAATAETHCARGPN